MNPVIRLKVRPAWVSHNALTSDLDADGHHIIDLPAAASATEPVRKAEFDAFTSASRPYEQIVSVRPSPLSSNYDSPATFFDGDIDQISLAISHWITGTATLGQPTTGYLYTPEAYPDVISFYNASGWNQSTSGNDGRTAAVAHYTQALHAGQGDLFAHAANVFVAGPAKVGATHWLANPAGTLFAGQCQAGVDGVYLQGLGDINLSDNGHDVSGIGSIVNLNRNNDTGNLDTYWAGHRVQSIGTKRPDDAFSAVGPYYQGLNFTYGDFFNNAAITLKQGHRIYGNSVPVGGGSLFYTTLNTDWIERSSSGFWAVVYNNYPSLQISDTQITAIAPTVIVPPAGLNKGISIIQASASGTATNPNLNEIAIADSVDAGSGVVNGMALYHGFGTSSAKGARQSLLVINDLTSATAATNPNRFYVAIDGIARASTSDGGGPGLGQQKGSLFGLNTTALLMSGATNMAEASGAEIDTDCRAGSSVLDKYGLKVAQVATDVVAGSRFDAALHFGNQAGAIGWGTLIQIGDGINATPLTTAGVVMNVKGSPTFAFGIDFAAATFTNFAFRAPNFTVNPQGMVAGSADDNLTAHAGGGQAAALLLAKVVNRVSTVATAADSVKLPASSPGMQITIINDAAVNSMQVFGTNPDTINNVATGTGVAQAAGKTAIYSCPVAGKWYRVLSA